jgi:hypothetical protein
MLRSVALAFSIVAFRFWMLVIFAVVVPETVTGGEVDPAALDQAIGLTSWVIWVVNLLIVQCWLHRRPGIRPPRSQRSSSRITTRRNPPETERVSAALMKPASSKSFRVPT